LTNCSGIPASSKSIATSPDVGDLYCLILS